jgi:hypothetical protein
MWMQVRMPLSYALFFLLVAAQASPPSHSSGELTTVMVRDAKLVYADELSMFARDPLGLPGPWPRHMPRNIDAFASGEGVVIGLFDKACDRAVVSGYAPSGCDGQLMVVIELASMPSVGDQIEVEDGRLLAAGAFSGDRNAGSRSGCLGYLERGRFEVTSRSGQMVTIRLKFEFAMMDHARYPKTCGIHRVEGEFEFAETSTDEFATGGLGNLFAGSSRSPEH